MSELPDPFRKYFCIYCQERMPELRIKCAECVDFLICLDCFSLGAEIGEHKNNHSYQFEDTGRLTSMGNGWTAMELNHLLRGVEKHGHGNWDLIAAEIQTKTANEARDEYRILFIDGNIGKVIWKSIEEKRSKIADVDSDEDDETPTRRSTLSAHVSANNLNDLGYNPEGDDFQQEYEAGNAVSNLSFSPDDSDLDRALKIFKIDVYTETMRKRAGLKAMINQHQRIKKFFAEWNKDPTKMELSSNLEKAILKHLRVLCPYMTATEHDQIEKRLIRAEKLKERIKQLTDYRKRGFRTFKECKESEQKQAAMEEIDEEESKKQKVAAEQSGDEEPNQQNSKSIGRKFKQKKSTNKRDYGKESRQKKSSTKQPNDGAEPKQQRTTMKQLDVKKISGQKLIMKQANSKEFKNQKLFKTNPQSRQVRFDMPGPSVEPDEKKQVRFDAPGPSAKPVEKKQTRIDLPRKSVQFSEMVEVLYFMRFPYEQPEKEKQVKVSAPGPIVQPRGKKRTASNIQDPEVQVVPPEDEEPKKKRKKKKALYFTRKKIHLPHCTPENIRLFNEARASSA